MKIFITLSVLALIGQFVFAQPFTVPVFSQKISDAEGACRYVHKVQSHDNNFFGGVTGQYTRPWGLPDGKGAPADTKIWDCFFTTDGKYEQCFIRACYCHLESPTSCNVTCNPDAGSGYCSGDY